MVKKTKKTSITETLIRQFHQIVMEDIDKEWAGKYRNSLVRIGGTNYKPPEAIAVPGEMADLIGWIKKKRKKLHVAEVAAIVHYKLVAIHPFFDGNGRVSRLIMNIILMQSGYPLVIILKNDRKRYFEILLKSKPNFKPKHYLKTK